jgi:hypothetical protein
MFIVSITFFLLRLLSLHLLLLGEKNVKQEVLLSEAATAPIPADAWECFCVLYFRVLNEVLICDFVKLLMMSLD